MGSLKLRSLNRSARGTRCGRFSLGRVLTPSIGRCFSAVLLRRYAPRRTRHDRLPHRTPSAACACDRSCDRAHVAQREGPQRPSTPSAGNASREITHTRRASGARRRNRRFRRNFDFNINFNVDCNIDRRAADKAAHGVLARRPSRGTRTVAEPVATTPPRRARRPT